MWICAGVRPKAGVMFEAATGEGGGEEAAAARAVTERPEKLSDCSEPFVQNRGKTAEKV